MDDKIEPFKPAMGRCNCFKGPKYFNQTTATDKCDSWGPEGGKGPGSEINNQPPRKPVGKVA
jgi:hypothetical protein